MSACVYRHIVNDVVLVVVLICYEFLFYPQAKADRCGCHNLYRQSSRAKDASSLSAHFEHRST